MDTLALLLFGMPGGWEWVIIALVVLLLFGAKRIPELAKGLGRGIREFKDASKGVKEEIKKEADDIKDAAQRDPGKEDKGSKA